MYPNIVWKTKTNSFLDKYSTILLVFDFMSVYYYYYFFPFIHIAFKLNNYIVSYYANSYIIFFQKIH